MPNIKSAKKRLRTSQAARERNKSVRSRVTTTRRLFQDAVVRKDAALGAEALKSYSSALDLAAKKNVIARNTADRRKSRAAKSLTALSVAATPSS